MSHFFFYNFLPNFRANDGHLMSNTCGGGQHLWRAASTVDGPWPGPEASLRKRGQEHGHYKATLSFPSTKPGR